MSGPQTQEERVCEQLRELVVSGAFPVNEFLSQRVLASQVGAAVVTVRGALRRLESDGLVESVPRWGVRIPLETAARVRDRYFMREILESAAARVIAAGLTLEQAAGLRGLAEQCDRVGGDGEAAVTEFAKRHFAFHRYIAELSGSPLLLEALARLSLRSLMVLNARRGWARGGDRTPTHHQDLAEAIVDGGVEAAETAMRQHVRNGMKFELEVLNG